MRNNLVAISFALLSLAAFADSMHVGPFLQQPGPSSIIVRWEGVFKNRPKVFVQEAPAGKIRSFPATPVRDHVFTVDDVLTAKNILFTSSIQGLSPNTTYHYWLQSDSYSGKKYQFKTLNTKAEDFAFLVMSDAQSGWEVTTRSIRESVMKYAFDEYPDEANFPIRTALFAGDLVQNGSQYSRWKKEFFDPMQPLLARIGTYPALGNHEEDDRLYFSYFDLPTNGSKGYLEHWYYFDYGNVRFITLDTNTKYRVQAQLDWLDKLLETSAQDPKIDFVIAQFHHPHKSELWLAGETAYSGELEKRLVAYSQKTAKPSLYFCGHTHGYSRGHHPTANHSMLIIGSIGGDTDNWGDYKQRDYPEYTKTLDEFGWMLVQVHGGEKPTLSIKRYSFGTDGNARDLGVVDEFVLRRFDSLPSTPKILEAQVTTSGKKSFIDFSLSDFSDLDLEDFHLSTMVQISQTASDTPTLVHEYLQNNENWYNGRDQNQGLSLQKFKLEFGPERDQKYYIRAKYRDSALGWSSFSPWKPISSR